MVVVLLVRRERRTEPVDVPILLEHHDEVLVFYLYDREHAPDGPSLAPPRRDAPASRLYLATDNLAYERQAPCAAFDKFDIVSESGIPLVRTSRNNVVESPLREAAYRLPVEGHDLGFVQVLQVVVPALVELLIVALAAGEVQQAVLSS